MAKIALRTYTHEIENLIERNLMDEAIAHCRQILHSYPKHIETYRLLAKIFLEQQKYQEASDVLQRVLSVLPDDFIAQIGMSLVREDEGDLDGAIWHMERAFECQTANTALQDEIRRLYGVRDGVEPPRVRLTRGALVRMYARGGHYQEAIAEIRMALQEDPNRPDLEVILAKMLYLSGARIEAIEACTKILSTLPYCYEANRILAEVLPGTSRSSDAKTYQQRVIDVDPYYAFVSPTAPTGQDVSPNAVMVDHLEYNPDAVDQTAIAWDEPSPEIEDIVETPTQTETTTEISESKAEPVEQSELETRSEQSHHKQTIDSQDDIAGEDKVVPGDEIEEPQGAQLSDDFPEWMREAGWSPASGIEDVEQVAQEEHPVAPDQPEPDIAQADVPEWLKSIAPDSVVETTEPSTPIAEGDESDALSDIPDWMSVAEDDQSTQVQSDPIATQDEPEQDSFPSTEEPDVSKDDTVGEIPAVIPSPEVEAPSEEPLQIDDPSLSWLQELSQDPVQGDKPLLPAEAQPSADVPEWVRALGLEPQAQPESQPDSHELTPPVPEEDAAPIADQSEMMTSGTETPPQSESPLAPEPIADWTPIPQDAEATEPKDESDLPDWLQALKGESPQDLLPDQPELEAPAQALSTDGDGLPEWLTQQPESSSQPDEDGVEKEVQKEETGLPEWLSEQQEPSSDIAPTDEPVDQEPVADALDFLDSLEGKPEVIEPKSDLPKEDLPEVEAGDIPDWLQDIVAAPQTPAVTEEVAPSEQKLKVSEPEPQDDLSAIRSQSLDTETVPEPESTESDLPEEEGESEVQDLQGLSSFIDAPAEETIMPEPIESELTPESVDHTHEEPAHEAEELPVAPEVVTTPPVQPTPSDDIFVGFSEKIKAGVGLDRIISALRELINEDGNQPGLWQLLGDALAKNDQLQEALDAYTKAEELLN
jgi:tetratricopeptide (TPR) repeat protein